MATPGRPLTDRERQRIVEMARAGQPAKEIARCVAVSKNTVNKILRKTA